MQRDETADISRGVGILLVIAGHAAFYTFQLNLIYFFHMPLFFFLSGIVHKKQAPCYSLKSGGYLAANYIAYGLLFSIVGWLCFRQNLPENLYRMASLNPAQIWEITGFGVYWFIVALVILRLLCASALIYKSWPIGLLLFFAVPVLKEDFALFGGLMVLGPALLGLFFYQMGRFYEPLLQLIRLKKWRILLSSSILYFSLATYSIAAFDGWRLKLVNMAHLHIFNPLLVLLLSLSGIVLTLAASSALTSFNLPRKTLGFFGRYSFILFATHLFFIQAFFRALPQSWAEQHATLANMLVLALSLAACTILALFTSTWPKQKTVVKKVLLMQ